MLPVYVPYVAGMLHEQTRSSVTRICSTQHREHTFIELRGDAAYFYLLEGLWRQGSGVIVVEQDIEPRDDVFMEFDDCPEHWCACTYDLGYGYDWALGCTKFAPELMVGHADVMDRVGEIGNDGLVKDGYPRMAWQILDNRIIRVLRERGLPGPHLHAPVWHRRVGLANAQMATP